MKPVRVRAILTETTAPLFSTLMFAGFHNQSPLLTMVKFSKQRETINLQSIQRRSQSPKCKFCKGKLTDCLLGIELVQVSQKMIKCPYLQSTTFLKQFYI